MSINSLNELWQAVCEDSKNYIAEVGYNTFIKDIFPIKMQEGKLVLGIGNEFKKDAVETYYKEILEKCCTNIMGLPLKIEITVKSMGEKEQNTAAAKTSINSIFTFDNFVVGPSNEFAHAACLSVANNPTSSQQYNPLLIYGNSGVGKTHLMLAVKNFVEEKNPNLKIEFIRCEDFTNEFIEATQTGTVNMFHQRFRTVDMLMVDDIQFIAGKKQTEEEFFNTFNALTEMGKQIILTSDRPPKEMQVLNERMQSRLEGGLIADINPPDFETRVGIINAKSRMMNFQIPENVVYFIAEQIKTNTRQLEGVVKKLQACVNLSNEVITIALAKNFIQEVVRDTLPDPITVDRIIEEVSRTYNVSKDEILSKSKVAEIAFARQVAIYVSWKVLNISYSEIGKHFGKNHTTVLYTINKMREITAADSYQKGLIKDIMLNLES